MKLIMDVFNSYRRDTVRYLSFDAKTSRVKKHARTEKTNHANRRFVSHTPY